jgi:hypothetical protein
VKTENIQRWMKKKEKGQKNIHTNQPFFKKIGEMSPKSENKKFKIQK